MIEAHLKRLRARHQVGAEEEAAIRSIIGKVVEYPAGKTFVRAGDELHFSTLVLDGMICRYKDLSEGQRQITELHVPGDFADLHSFTLKRLDHNLMALTDCRVALAPHSALNEITEKMPHLTRLYWFSTNLDAAIHREWVLSLGRRSALSRTAHLFCEMQARLELVDMADKSGYALPLNQTDLAECLGLTPVHVNRSLRRLREDGLVTFRGGRVDLHDLNGLKDVAEFDPAYLYLNAHPL